MSEPRELLERYRGVVFAEFGQVALLDGEHPDPFPQWPAAAGPAAVERALTGPHVVFGPAGVAVQAAKGDVEVLVYEGAAEPAGGLALAGTGSLTVGRGGVAVADVSPVGRLDWPPGRVAVRVHTAAAGAGGYRLSAGPGRVLLAHAGGGAPATTRVAFVLQRDA
jgi:hypothetical protein